MPLRKVLKLNYCSNISACSDTVISNQFNMHIVWGKHLRANKNMIRKTHLSTQMILQTVLVDEDKVCSRPLLSTQPAAFLFGNSRCCVPLVDLKLLTPCYQSNAKKVTRLTAHTASARC